MEGVVVNEDLGGVPLASPPDSSPSATDESFERGIGRSRSAFQLRSGGHSLLSIIIIINNNNNNNYYSSGSSGSGGSRNSTAIEIRPVHAGVHAELSSAARIRSRTFRIPVAHDSTPLVRPSCFCDHGVDRLVSIFKFWKMNFKRQPQVIRKRKALGFVVRSFACLLARPFVFPSLLLVERWIVMSRRRL